MAGALATLKGLADVLKLCSSCKHGLRQLFTATDTGEHRYITQITRDGGATLM